MNSTYSLLRKVVLVTILVLGIPALALYAVLEVVFYYDTCPDDWWLHDSPEITNAEKHDLLQAMQQIYSRPHGPYQIYSLPRPIEVLSIKNHGAVVRVASEYSPGNGAYERAWYQIFRRFHPSIGKTCARITYVFPAGTAQAQCCNTYL